MPLRSPSQQLRLKLDTRLRKAVRDYGLIDDGDRILIGLSGGKDSMALVTLLGDMSRIFRPRFEVLAVHVRLVPDETARTGKHADFPMPSYKADIDCLRRHCEAHGVEFHVSDCPFRPDADPSRSPCFLCSWNRRKTLFEAAKAHSCNKIALGHHRDDFLETLLLNMFFQGSIQAVPPKLAMDKFPMEIIRPLCLTDESDLAQFAANEGYPTQEKNCPYEHDSHRSDVHQLLAELSERFPGLKDSLWASMSHIYPKYLP